jgi:hypothetical protein
MNDDYEMKIWMMRCEVYAGPTLPYDHITQVWDGA